MQLSNVMARIESQPIAKTCEFEVSDREAQKIRSRLYAINKDGIRKHRTMREGPLLIVWRLR